MKKMKSFKNWILISMLFIGISLTVYAIAPRVTISNAVVDNITSTTADVTVAYSGATVIEFWASFTPDEDSYEFVTSTPTMNEVFDYVTYYLAGFTPDTTYYLKIVARGDSGDEAYTYVNFRTLLAE